MGEKQAVAVFPSTQLSDTTVVCGVENMGNKADIATDKFADFAGAEARYMELMSDPGVDHDSIEIRQDLAGNDVHVIYTRQPG